MANNFSRREFFKIGGASAAGLGISSLLAACGGSGSGSDSDTIKIGIMGPYSGDVAQYGTACRDGAKLFFKQNKKVGDYKISVDAEDEKGDATEAVNVYNKLVESGVVAIVGDVTSTPSIAVAQQSVNDNIPLVTPSATAADFIKYGSNAFRACITDPFQGKLMADFADQQGYKTVGVIYNSGGDYEAGCEAAFVKEAKKKGITIAPDPQGYSAGDTDFNSLLTTIINAKPDAIFSPNYYQDDGKIVTQARQQGYTGPFLGCDGWSNIVGGEEEYASAEDLEGCYYDCSFNVASTDDKVQKFIKDFEAEYDYTPTNFCALGYDAANIVYTAIKKALKDGGDPTSDDFKQSIIDDISKGTVDGVTGTIKYDGSGDPVKPTLIITFKDGKETIATTIEAD